MTYDELSQLRGIGRESAVKLVQRKRWRRVPGNDGVARVLVPLDWLTLAKEPSGERSPEQSPEPSGDVLRAIEALEDAVALLREQLADTRAMRTEAQAEARELRDRLVTAEAAAEQARREAQEAIQAAEELREADVERQGRGRWARLRAAWRRGVVALLVVAAGSANAQNTPNTWFSIGDASKSCGTFVEAVERNSRLTAPNDPFGFSDPEAAALMSWIDGFISGENSMGASDNMAGQRADAASRYRWVENYCRGHPLDRLTEAALALRRDLIARGM